MTSRRRAEEFAAAVDDRSSTLPEHVDAAFLDLVARLRDLEQPTMRADFSADLRSRLMDEAATVLAEPAAPAGTRRDAAVVAFPASPRRRLASATVAVCIVAGSAAGVAAASQAALPGEALYPVKRGIEHIEVAVAGSQGDKGREHLEQASTRLDEISDLSVAHGEDPTTPTLMRKTLETFSNEAEDGADELMQAYGDTSDPSNIADLRSFADTSATRLDALSGVLPGSADDALARAAQVLQQLDRQAQDLCSECSVLPTLTLSGGLLDLSDGLVPGTTTSPGSLTPRHGGGQPQTDAPGQVGEPPGQSPTDLPTVGGNLTLGDDPGSDDPGSSPGLPGLTGLDPTQAGPTPTSGSPTGGGVTVKLPGGGGVTANVPSVPVPPISVDLGDPLGSIPQVIDDVTGGLGLGLGGP